MDRSTLVNQLKQYQTSFQEEKEFIPRFLSLLSDASCFERTHLPGHITGSAWIVDATRAHVLLVHHAKLNKWVQPGGHADGDENIERVALKEVEEETGLKNLNIIGSQLFDVDIHLIPKRGDFPEHFHFDVRFLMEADLNDSIQVSEESHDVRWVRLDELDKFNPERSVLRMREKLF